MSIKRNLRKAAELGIGLTALSTLILAGCGGGGSSSSSSGVGGNIGSSATTMNVTPGKGVMIGAVVTIKDANGNVLGNASTTNAGVAAVSIPSTATAPFIVSVSCPAACQYFDEKTMAMHSGAANMPPLLAAVPTAGVTNIGVTAATHAAAQYAIAAGALTPAAVTAANNTVIAQLGLTGVADILTPPTIINSQATLNAAKAGATDADKLANYSAALAQAASGVTAIEAIAAYGDAWKQAALVPASGVILPPTIDPAVVTLNAPTFVVAPIANIASAVAAQTQQVASEVAAVNHMLADGTAGGLREWFPSFIGQGATMAPDVVHTHALSSTGGNAYAGTSSYKELAANGWVALSANYQPSAYTLTPAGWQMYDQADTFVDNLNGTVTTTSNRGVVTEHVTEAVLDGQPIVCRNPATLVTVACAAPANYPVGSRRYSGAGGVSSKDLYKIWPNDAYYTSTVTNMSGAALTALPVLGTDSFCSSNGVFTPIVNPAAGADNYNVYWTAGCTAASITAATQSIAAGTVRLSAKQTGNSVVPVVGIANAAVTSPVSWLNNDIIAVVNGTVMGGTFRPAGSAASRIFYANKTALDAELVANGLPSSNVANTAGATTGVATASGAAAITSLIADATAVGGGTVSWSGFQTASGVSANATISAAVLTAGSTYTVTDTRQTLSLGAWGPGTGALGNQYFLSATGWQLLPTTRTYSVVNNGDGTMSINGNGFAGSATVTKTDLSGMAISCGNPMGNNTAGVLGGACPAPGSYPAGSSRYVMTQTLAVDEYYLVDMTNFPMVLTDGAGVALTALPAAGTRFCVSGQVFDPIAGAAAGADNYNVYWGLSCAAADIATALAGPIGQTALVTQKQTGNTAVPTVGLAQYKATAFTPAYNTVLAFNLGKVMSGTMNPAGMVSTMRYTNKVATNAALVANGLPPLP